MRRIAMAIVITFAAITIVSAAGMIVSPGSFMGLNTKPDGGSGPPVPPGVSITTLAGDPITTIDAQNLETL